MSYVDLLRRRGAAGLAIPDAVVLPADPGQVQRVLEVCAAHDIGVVPFGGGTSVVGGVTAVRGGKTCVLVLDLQRLDRLVSVDPVSRIAVFQAGTRGPDAERMLAGYGLTLGHVPQSFERATLGGFAATQASGQASSGYGRFEEMVTGLRLATPAGEWRPGASPASAAGPDLKRLAIGSEGTLGVVTELAVRVRPIPAQQRFEAFVLDGWDQAMNAARTMAQRGVLADVTRVSDPEETETTLVLGKDRRTTLLRRYLKARRVRQPCLLILGWDGEPAQHGERHRRQALRILRSTGAVRLGRGVGETWHRERFSGPRQRDALLDLGVCVETLETAANWSQLRELYERVRTTVHSTMEHPLVLCRLSHIYETGACLSFTVLTARDYTNPIGQWQRVKHAVSQAIADGPLGTISHHHGVGTEHAPYLPGEVGDLGVAMLRAAKSAVDPTGILNPGKLLP